MQGKVADYFREVLNHLPKPLLDLFDIAILYEQLDVGSATVGWWGAPKLHT
jgi:hypothetical protein